MQQNIDIQTTQNVSIEYELAGLRDRFVAMLLDCIIFYGTFAIIAFLIFTSVPSIFDSDSMGVSVFFGLSPVVGFMLYHLIAEVVANGQSIGKKMMGLKVVRIDGEEVGLSDFLLRAVFHLVDTFFSMGIVAAILISSSQKKQRLGDMTSNTTVIKLKSKSHFKLDDILKIQNTQNYEVAFPEAKHFKESDMLLVKTIIARYKKYPNKAHGEALTNAVLRFSKLLELEEIPKNKIEFLKTLLKDYVVLTR